MPIAVIAVSMLVILAVATPSEASQSCMSKTEARQHIGSVHIYWHGRDHCWDATLTRRHHQNKVQRKLQIHEVQENIDQPNWHDSMSKMLPDDELVQTPWVDRWANIELSRPIVARWVDIVQVAPLPIIERETEPMVTPRGVMLVLVFIAIVLTLETIEVLFRCTIYER
jgi:hypothetical protein